MKNKVLFLVSTLLLGGLTGCGGSGETVVKFWHTMGQANQDLLNRMIAEFETANPDIKIEAYSQGGYDDIAKKLGDAIPAGTTPTMSFCYPDNVASYLTSGAIQDMTSFIDHPEYGFTEEEKGVEDFIESYWKEGTEYTSDKAVYSVPYAKSTEVIFYNYTVFDYYKLKVPTTWDEMWALCEQITTDPTLSKKGYVPLGYDSDSNLFITMCEQYGIPYTTKEGAPEDRFLFNNDQAKDMVRQLKQYYDNGYLVTKGTQENSTYTSTLFTNGKLLMSIGSTGGTTYNKSINFEVGVAPIPSGKLNGHAVSQGPSICFFKRAREAEKVAAWKFYKHITSTINSANYSIRTGYEPVRSSSYQSPQYQSYLQTAGANYICSQGANLLATTATLTRDKYQDLYFTTDVFKGSDTARDEVGAIISNVLLETKTVDEAFNDAITKCLFTA